MNKIIRTYNEKNEPIYTLITENNREYICRRWLEKKPNKTMWHIVLPKEASEETGRTYIRESYFDNSDTYEFENKTEHRENMSSGGWRSRLTPEELKRLEEAEKTIEELKKIGTERKPVKNDLNTEDGLEAEIQRLLELQRQKYGTK